MPTCSYNEGHDEQGAIAYAPCTRAIVCLWQPIRRVNAAICLGQIRGVLHYVWLEDWAISSAVDGEAGFAVDGETVSEGESVHSESCDSFVFLYCFTTQKATSPSATMHATIIPAI